MSWYGNWADIAWTEDWGSAGGGEFAPMFKDGLPLFDLDKPVIAATDCECCETGCDIDFTVIKDCLTANVAITGTPIFGLAIEWDFGDGYTTLGETASHTYEEAGTYEICMTVTCPNESYMQVCHNVSMIDCICDCQISGSALTLTGFANSPTLYYYWNDLEFEDIQCNEDGPPAAPDECVILGGINCYPFAPDSYIYHNKFTCLWANLNSGFGTTVIYDTGSGIIVEYIQGTEGDAGDRGLIVSEVESKRWCCEWVDGATCSGPFLMSVVYSRLYVTKITHGAMCVPCADTPNKWISPGSAGSPLNISFQFQRFYDYDILRCDPSESGDPFGDSESGTTQERYTPNGRDLFDYVFLPTGSPFDPCTRSEFPASFDIPFYQSVGSFTPPEECMPSDPGCEPEMMDLTCYTCGSPCNGTTSFTQVGCGPTSGWPDIDWQYSCLLSDLGPAISGSIAIS